MRKKFFAALAALLLLSGCGSREAVEAEIKIPILEEGAAEYQTAEVTRGNVTQTANVAGKIGYIYADELMTDFSANILEFSAKRGDKLKAGDVIAVFDSSSVDYDYSSAKILADDAYSKYLSSGSESARLDYEICQKELELVQYRKDQYTIRAPYDCIVTSTASFEIGQAVNEGEKICTVARQGEIYVTTDESKDYFRTGMPVSVKFGSTGEYAAHVVMTPTGSGGARGSLNSQVVIAFDDGELDRALSDVDNLLSAGWATIIVATAEKYNVLTLPEYAVKSFSGSDYCSLIDNGERVRVPVELDGVYGGTAVIRTGVSEGDIVAY